MIMIRNLLVKILITVIVSGMPTIAAFCAVLITHDLYYELNPLWVYITMATLVAAVNAVIAMWILIECCEEDQEAGTCLKETRGRATTPRKLSQSERR